MFYQMAAMMILVFVTGVKHIGAENILKEIKEGTNKHRTNEIVTGRTKERKKKRKERIRSDRHEET